MDRLDKYRGIFPAFYACYDDHGDVSPERTQVFTRYLIEKGVQGLYVCGSSGECIYQTPEERMLILENVMKVAKGKITVIAHIAAPSTRDSIRLAKHAQSCQVDAVAAIPPIYFVLPEYAIEKYWMDMVDATDLDFVIYNIPQTTGYALSMNLFDKMRQNKKVIGVKNSSMPVQDILNFKSAAGNDFIIFNGPDEQFVGGRLMGADSGIGGTYGVMPELFLKANAYVTEGAFQKAQKVQFAIDEIIRVMCSCKGNLYAVMKEILKRNGMNIGGARLPLAAVEPEDMEMIERADAMIKQAVKTL
ncbi:MAG: dihydrodipicolinate synthase family protein [Lachnospiraceae bacterium]|jgi:N-acetylneuraminate lyase|nr:dihydrodipicolinate synthase family protein [Lachnospiraceae bacterium]